jgi:hypothetical protein
MGENMGIPCKEPWTGGNITRDYVEVVNKDTDLSIIGQKIDRPGMWVVFVKNMKVGEIPRGDLRKAFKCIMEKVGQNTEINVDDLKDQCL